MSDTVTNAEVAAVAPPVLKSNDTRAAKADAPPATEAKPEPVTAKADTPQPDADTSTADDAGGHDDTDAPTAEAPRDKPKQRLPRWMQERLERERQVTRERTRAEMLVEFQRTQPAAPAPQPEPAGRVKTMEDFDFDPDRYTEYLVEQKLEARSRREQQAQAQREAAAKLETFKSRVDTFEARAGAGAWEDIATSPLNTDPGFAPLVDAFMGEACDLDIAHHLAQNLDEARRLMGLSPIARARELTKLADRFENPTPATAETKPEPKPKTVTQAPPPPSKLGSGKPSVDINNPQLSTADRIAQWKKSRQA